MCACACVLRRGVRLQIIAFIGILESFSYEKIYYGDSAPGDLGFDPLGVSDDASRAKHYAVRPAPPVTVSRLVDSAEAVLTGAASLQRAEVMNGRLAMIGFSGMLHHAILTKMVRPRPCERSPRGEKRQPRRTKSRAGGLWLWFWLGAWVARRVVGCLRCGGAGRLTARGVGCAGAVRADHEQDLLPGRRGLQVKHSLPGLSG